MEEKEIIQGNSLIVEFMGSKVQSDLTCKPYPSKLPYWAMRLYNFDTMKIGGYEYHESFDWLMPVVEKIESLATDHIDKIYVSINGKSCMIWNYYDPVEVIRTIGSGSTYKIKKVAETKLLATYEAVVDFVKWYNTLNTKQSSE